MFTNINESGLESIIVNWLVERNGYEQGANSDYDQEYALDTTRLFRFLENTQPGKMAALGLRNNPIQKQKFLNRLQGELAKRGVIDVLRYGFNFFPVNLDAFYMTPSEGNNEAERLFNCNIFSVTRQLRYSSGNALALDLCIFINGLPVLTFELKNQLTKQTVADAVEQYKNDRSERETLFAFKRCAAHFAVDDSRIKFCTRLAGKDSWFLPFDKGYNAGAGNPPNPNGLKTAYLWEDILTKQKLTRILESYAQVVKKKDPETRKESSFQIWPRYHQLDAVESILTDVRTNGIGKRYLIQHSAGSGKSNSISWLAYQLIELTQNGRPMFDSVLIVTDRVILDEQARDNIKQFMQLTNTVSWAKNSADLRLAISDGKRIIVTTIEKFPYILKGLGTSHRNHRFGIIIDEAHSSQSGRTAGKMNLALSGSLSDDSADDEDKINQLMEGKRLLKNASYFAFTATPKNKTLELFGEPYTENGEIMHRPFHVYTMKQAIQEGFILDVLLHYTPIQSYYKLIKKIEDDPQFDSKKAKKKLRSFVESDAYTIAQKAEIIVDHFHNSVQSKIGGQARAMVITSSIDRCLEYFKAIKACLETRHSPYKAIVAYSGQREFEGAQDVTSAQINGFADGSIRKTFKRDPYRFLVVADMFQTGYDEPLLHTMYVDKPLSDIKAVQTLSRLNRACPKKHDTFVLDFANDIETIFNAFSRYYRATILSGETDPNVLYDLTADMEHFNVFTKQQIETVVHLYINGISRDQLDPTLDRCASEYQKLSTDEQIQFKGTAKAFARTYNFLAAILPIGNPDWEKQSIFLNLLIPKLPSPPEDDLSLGILETIDLESYRLEIKKTMSISLQDEDATVNPAPTGTGTGKPDPQLDLLSEILSNFNSQFGNIDWKDEDNVRRQIERIPEMVSNNEKYQNAIRDSDKENAKMESDRATGEVINAIMSDSMELFQQFQDNPEFKKWLQDRVFQITYPKLQRS